MSDIALGDYLNSQRVQKHPAVIFVPALLCSFFLHVLAVYFIPALPIGKTPELAPEKEYTDFSLGDVRPEPLRSMSVSSKTPEPLSRPQSDATVARVSDSFREALKPWLETREKEQVVAMVESLELEKLELEEVALPKLAARQEIMAVDRALLRPDAGLLPRVFIPELPRIDVALDVVLPVERLPESLSSLPGVMGASLPTPSLTALPDVVLASFPDISVGGEGASFVGPSVLTEEPSAIVEHALDTLTPFVPAENLVDIRTEVYVAADERHVRYFRIQLLPRSEQVVDAAPRRLMFIQDCSESMSIWKLRRCREGWLHVLSGLREDDVFNIMTFRDEVSLCFTNFTSASSSALAQARLYVSEMRPRGKTDVHASLEYLSRLPPLSNAATLALLVTDGRPTMGVVDSTDIIESFSRQNEGRVSLFTVGSGKEANRYLLDLMGYRNRGGTLLVRDNGDLPGAMERMNRQLYRPVLLNPIFRFIGSEGLEVYPKRLTHLYMDRPLTMMGKVPAGVSELAFQLIGHSRKGRHDMVFRIHLEEEVVSSEDLRLAWAWQKMYALIGDVTASGGEADKLALRRHALQTGLIIPYAMEASDPIRR